MTTVITSMFLANTIRPINHSTCIGHVRLRSSLQAQGITLALRRPTPLNWSQLRSSVGPLQLRNQQRSRISMVRIDLTSGSCFLSASHLTDFEAEYALGQVDLSEETRAILIQICLNVAAESQFTWRSVHNHMIMRCSVTLMIVPSSITLNTFFNSVPPIDEDKKAELLHAPLKSPTLFRGALAKRTWNGMGQDLHRFSLSCSSLFLLFQPALHGSWSELQEGFLQLKGNREQDKPASLATSPNRPTTLRY